MPKPTTLKYDEVSQFVLQCWITSALTPEMIANDAYAHFDGKHNLTKLDVARICRTWEERHPWIESPTTVRRRALVLQIVEMLKDNKTLAEMSAAVDLTEVFLKGFVGEAKRILERDWV